MAYCKKGEKERNEKTFITIIVFVTIIICNNCGTGLLASSNNYLEYSKNDYAKYYTQIPHYDNQHKGVLETTSTCEPVTKQIKKTTGWIWGSENGKVDSLRYVIYKVGVLNAAYSTTPIGYINSGFIEDTFTVKIEDSYEESLSTTLSSQVSSTSTAGVNYNIFASKSSVTASVNSSITTTVVKTHSTSKTKSTRIHYDINVLGYYSYDGRALYTLYVVQVYKIQYKKVEYDTKRTGVATDHYYKYVENGYYLQESYLTYSLVSDLGICITRYKHDNNGMGIYDGPKENGTYIYI